MAHILTLLVFVGLSISAGAFACDEHGDQAEFQPQQAIEALVAMKAAPARSCNTSLDCLINENCINGQCVFGRCLSDIDCPIGERCVGGTCRR